MDYRTRDELHYESAQKGEMMEDGNVCLKVWQLVQKMSTP